MLEAIRSKDFNIAFHRHLREIGVGAIELGLFSEAVVEMTGCAPPSDSFPSGYLTIAGLLIFGNGGIIDCVWMLPVSSGALSGFNCLITIQDDSLQLLYRRKLGVSFCRGSWEYEVKAEQY